MLKTITTALLAVSMLVAPALAAQTSTPAVVEKTRHIPQQTTVIKKVEGTKLRVSRHGWTCRHGSFVKHTKHLKYLRHARHVAKHEHFTKVHRIEKGAVQVDTKPATRSVIN